MDWTHRTASGHSRRNRGSQPCRSSPSSRARATSNKRDLVKRVTDAFVDAYHIPAETVQVWIHEVPADSWGVAGKLTAEQVALTADA
ncbi:tautomerase family protein [Streptomyces sp. NPDC047017]|uniref:tautomerase family protein n=1 Tax=Streptomyces sp. NPDC047017 TaxID=3155024 RepID=UPI0033F40D97